jgi:serine/threonine protein kinase
MELMQGGSLTSAYAAARAAAGPAWRPPAARALRHAAQLFRALEHLHVQAPAILHRDVKPSNLLVTADLTTLKLADFGVRGDPFAFLAALFPSLEFVFLNYFRSRGDLLVILAAP